MTTWSAYAAFEDSTRGKILPGYDADLTVLSVNPVTCDPQALLSARVLMTIVGGRVVWHDKKGFRVLDVPDNTASATPASSVDNDS
ncbi:hypothetical protein ES703_53279 [subsurface metagenome]